MRTAFFVITLLAGLFLLPPGPSTTHAGTVRDHMNREVMVPENPQRIVALAPSVTEIVFALGQGHRLKGVTLFSNYPPSAEKLPRVGSYVHPEIERIAALKPDLCIGIRDGNPVQIVGQLDTLRIPLYIVNPVDLETVMESIVLIGTILDARAQAQKLVQKMAVGIQQVKQRTAMSAHRPRVFFQIGIAPIVSAGAHTFIHEIIKAAGGKNCAAGPAPYPRFSREEVLVLAPEVIIITSMARASSERFDEVKKVWSSWTNIPAVRNNRIHVVDSDIFDRPGPRMVEGLMVLASLLHPELYTHD